MPKLASFPMAQQATSNSCWACASRCISNWYQSLGKSGPNPVYNSDQEFANAWAKKSGDPTHADIKIQQSAAAALGDLGFVNNTDDAPLPKPDEISDAIKANMPLLAIIGPTAPAGGKPDLRYQQGHWVVVIGISDDESKITVFDPDDGAEHEIAYSAANYGSAYWENTSYVDPA